MKTIRLILAELNRFDAIRLVVVAVALTRITWGGGI